MPDSIPEAFELQKTLSGAFGTRYQLFERLGKGAYGVVFRARDTMLDRDVAIKQVRLDHCGTASHADEVKRRTQREAKMAAKLRHPNIVTVHDIVHTEESTLIIMEFVDGKTLESQLEHRARLGLEETIALVAQTADALDYAHSQGVIHRDIKPANLMIDVAGHVKITDFGIAKSQTGSELTSNITASGNVLGTPYYMSPEQARGEDTLDGRSDLFSLGCVTYECLSGVRPFRGKAVVDVLLQIVNGTPAELDCDALELHPYVEPILSKALSKTLQERFSSARAFVDALRTVPASEPTVNNAMPVVTSRAPGANASFDAALQGSLGDRGLAEIIRDIQTTGKTGILHLERDDLAKRLYFLDGAMVFANSDVESDRLGQFLIGGGIIDASSYELAARTMRRTRRRLGRTLVALGNVEESELDELINEQIQRIIYSVFGWESGRYRFETIEKPVEEDIARKLETDEIVLAGIRNMASASTIRQFIGSTDRILHTVVGSPADAAKITLTSSEGFVLSRVDGNTSVAEIVSLSPLSEEETLRCVYGLLTAGILRLEERKKSATGRVPRVAERKQAQPAERADAPSAKEDAIVAEVAAKRAALEDADHYEALDVSRGDTPAAIKKAYYALAKRFHPDRHHVLGSDELKQDLEAIVARLSDAYEVLSHPAKRLRYDGSLSSTTNDGPDPEGVATIQTSPRVVAESKYRAGMGFYKDEAYHEAVQNLREAVRLAPTNLAYHKLLGRALTKNPKWRKQAEGHLRRVLDAHPYDLDCYLELATIYEEGGLSVRARKMYEQIVRLDPEHETALEKLGRGDRGGSPFARKIFGKRNRAAH